MTRTSRGAGNEVSTLDGQTLPGSLVDYVEHSEALGAVQRVMHEVKRPLVITTSPLLAVASVFRVR